MNGNRVALAAILGMLVATTLVAVTDAPRWWLLVEWLLGVLALAAILSDDMGGDR